MSRTLSQTQQDSGQDLPTACVLCSHNCGLRVDVRDNRIVAVRPDDSSPISRGYSCHKGFSIAHYAHHAQRLQQPLRRRADGTFEPISWQDALSEIATKLRAIVQRGSPRAFALIGGGGQGNHLNVPYGSAFRMAVGSPWWFNALAQEKTQHPLIDKWLFNAPSESWLEADIEHSAFVILLGTNPLLSNRGRNAAEYIKSLHQSPSRTLVVVDPRRTETAQRAHLHIAPRPGSDVFLLLGMAAHIVQNRRFDVAFLAHHVIGAEPLLQQLRAIDVAQMAERCAIAPAQLRALSDGFADAPSATMYMDLGLEHGLFSTLTSYLMRVILVLTGNLGRRGGAVFHGTFSPATLPFRRSQFRAPVSGIEAIEALGPFGMFSPNLAPEEILRDHPERIQAVIVDGANPVVQYADSQRYREALAKLELLVVIDPAFSETARLAHYVLPTPVGYEKWEYSGFPKGYPEIHAQLRPPVLRGPDDALPEGEIYARLYREYIGAAPASRVLHQLARKVKRGAWASHAYLAALVADAARAHGDLDARLARIVFQAYETLGPTLPAKPVTYLWLLSQLFAATRRAELLRAFPQAAALSRFALGDFLFEQLLSHPEGTVVGCLDDEHNFTQHVRHRGHKVHIAPPAMLEELRRALAFQLESDEHYPFVLNGGRRTRWNANTIQRDPAWRKGKGPHCSVYMAPQDAQQLGILDGALVRVESRRGALELPVALDPTLTSGQLAIPNGFGLDYPDPETGQLIRSGACINELTDSAARDPFTGSPHHKYVRCKLTPL